MKIVLDIKALSVNKAWRGRRFKTPEYKAYEQAVGWLLKPYQKLCKARRTHLPPLFRVSIVFHLKRASTTDLDNLTKLLLDILVANKIIPDDRHIWKLEVEKVKAIEDKIEIKISNFKKN